MRINTILFLMLLLVACKQNKQATDVKADLLFDQYPDNWFEGGDAQWQFNDGILVGQLDSGAGFVMTEQTYEHFEMEVEFYPDSIINSGIFVRCLNQDISATDCYEINIWDLHPNQEFRTGAIVTRSSPEQVVNTIGKWNTYKIRCQGDSIIAWINNKRTVAIRDSDRDQGYIALQAAGSGSIQFRNFSIKPLNGE